MHFLFSFRSLIWSISVWRFSLVSRFRFGQKNSNTEHDMNAETLGEGNRRERARGGGYRILKDNYFVPELRCVVFSYDF